MFAPVVVGEFFISLLATVVLFALNRRDPTPAVRLWAIAFLMQSATTALVAHRLVGPEHRLLMGLAAVAGLLCAIFFVWGTLKYLGRTLGQRWLLVPVAIALYQLPGFILGWPFAVRAAPVVMVMGGSVIVAGAALLRDWARSVGARITGLGFVAYGVHVFDYPLADSFPQWLTWGHMLAGFFQAAICTGLVLLHFEKATDTLAEEKRRYQALFENAIVGIFRADASGTIVSANATLRRRVAGEGSLVGRPLRAVFVEPNEADALLQSDGPELSVHALQWRADTGEVVDVQLYVQRSGEGGVEGVVVDVTRRATLERHLDQVQRAEVLGQLAGGIAHDLNNVLTVVMGNAQQLRSRARGEAALTGLVDAISTATDQGASLTRQLLTFARSHPSKRETFELGPRVEQAVRMVQATLGEGISLDLAIAPKGCLVSGDAGLLEQVVVNLVLNARDAMPEGGRLGVTVRHEMTAPVVWLEVQDSGAGMDEATRARIFEPFFSTKPEGTGLGLAVAQRVVRQAGGHIEVQSEPGQGTTFRVQLPCAMAAQPAAPAATQSPTTARVLLVEDRHNVRAIMALQLRGAGYEVVASQTSAEAVRQLKDGLAVDLLITDVRMPPPTGPEVAQAFRAKVPDAPVLFVSGFSDESLSEALAGRNSRFLAKPFTEAQLLGAVQELLAGRTAAAVATQG